MIIEGSFRIKVTREEEPIRTIVTATIDGLVFTAEGNRMAYQLPSDKQIHVQVAYVDAGGNPAKVDTIDWSSSDTSVLTVTQDDTDPSKALIAPVGTVGQGQVVATADVDLGPGVKHLLTMMDVQIVSGEAVAGTIAPVGDPEPKP